MCWSTPGKIVDITGKNAVVEIAGVRKGVMLDLVSGVKKGDYVLVHAGYAIQKVNEENANFTINFFKGKGLK